MIFIYGAGARSKLILMLLKDLKIKKKIILIDNNYKKKIGLNSEDFLIKNYRYSKDEFLFGFSDPILKQKIFERLKKKIKLKILKPLISKSAIIKSKYKIGYGSIIMDKSFIGENAKIGKNCFVGIDSIINHDTILRDFVEISHKVKIAGNVEIDKGSYLGMGSIIVQKKKIGKNCFVGAGVLVKKNLKNKNKITLKQNIIIK